MKRTLLLIAILAIAAGMIVMSGCSKGQITELGTQWARPTNYAVPIVGNPAQGICVTTMGDSLLGPPVRSYTEEGARVEGWFLERINSGQYNISNVYTQYTEKGQMVIAKVSQYRGDANNNFGRGIRVEVLRGDYPDDVPGEANQNSLQDKLTEAQQRYGSNLLHVDQVMSKDNEYLVLLLVFYRQV